MDKNLFAPEGALRMAQRFIQLSDVSEILNISSTQAYALVRSGELNAIKVGGRGQWRIEATELENYIQRMYSETKTFVAAHPFGAPTDSFGMPAESTDTSA